MTFKMPVNVHRNLGRKRTLYVIESGEFIKVGIADNIDQRLFQLQAGNPLPLRVRMARSMPAALAIQVERKAHEALAEYAIGREWFRAEASAAIAIARPLVQRAERAMKRIEADTLARLAGTEPGHKYGEQLAEVYASVLKEQPKTTTV